MKAAVPAVRYHGTVSVCLTPDPATGVEPDEQTHSLHFRLGVDGQTKSMKCIPFVYLLPPASVSRNYHQNVDHGNGHGPWPAVAAKS